jgi:hypothetical protein
VGNHYLTLVYHIDERCRRLLCVVKARRVKTLLRFFRWFGKERSHELMAKGYEPVLKHARWLLLKRPENPDRGPRNRLAEFLKYLRSVSNYLPKQDFQFFRDYQITLLILDRWCTRAYALVSNPSRSHAAYALLTELVLGQKRLSARLRRGLTRDRIERPESFDFGPNQAMENPSFRHLATSSPRRFC